jgi:hypothetical protein
MIGTRYHGLESGPLDSAGDLRVIGSHIDVPGAALPRALGYPNHHRFAAEVGESFSRKPSGGIPRRDHDRK